MFELKRSQIAGMNLSYRYFSFDYFLDSMERIGFQSVEIWGASPHFYVPDLTPSDIRAAAKKIKDHGLRIVCFTPEQCCYPENIAEKDSVARKRSVAFYEKTIEACAELGSPQILMASGWGYFDEAPEEAWKRSADGLAQLSRAAERVGVTIVLEPLRAEETNLVTTLPQLKRMLDEVGSPALKAMIDTSPMYLSGETITDYFRTLGGDLRHIHFVDGDPAGHLAWGTGIFPLERYIAELKSYEYQNALTLELTAAKYFSDPNASMAAAFQYLQGYFTE